MPEFKEDAFALFSTFNRSKIEGKENEYWSKSEWPLEQIKELYKWAVDPATPISENQKGERCVTVNQKLLPRTSKNGNPYLLGVTSGKKEDMPF